MPKLKKDRKRKRTAKRKSKAVEYIAPDPPWAVCPHCWTVGYCSAFDCSGADDGNVFCNQCGDEFTAPNIIQQHPEGVDLDA